MQPRARKTIGWAIAAVVLLGLVSLGVGAASRKPKATFSHTGTVVNAPYAANGLTSSAGGTIGGTSAAGQGARGPQTAPQPASNASSLPNVPDRIIRTADITVEVKKGSFDSAWSAAFRVAQQFGGQIMSSSRGIPTPQPVPIEGTTSSSKSTPPFGQITIQIPAQNFIKTTNALRGLGVVRGDNTSTQDVSQEYVDLQSRLRNLRAEQNVLLALFNRAHTINDTLLVQRQVSDVEGQIEQVTGRIKYLDARTLFSTVTLHLQEPGVAIVTILPKSPSFGGAWETAKTGFTRIVGAALIVGLALAPLAVLGLIGFGVWRRIRRPAPQV